MTDTNRSLSEVVALLEERRRYEGWLDALQARRDATPSHVFERVHADYLSRLARVDEQLETHRQAIEEERASVQSRLSLLEAEERMRVDERAELELRSHVGELVGEEAEGAFRTVDESLEQLRSEKTSLQARVVELEALLEPRSTPSASSAGAPAPAAADPTPAPEPQQPTTSGPPAPAASAEPTLLRTPSGSFDELAFLHTVVGDDAPAAAAPDDPHAGGLDDPHAGGLDDPHAGGVEAPATMMAMDDPHAGGLDDPNAGGLDDPHAGGLDDPHAGGADAPLLTASRRDSTIVRDDPGAPSLLAGVGETPPRSSTGIPLAANVSANTPIVLKSSGGVEQVKTLKCSECGAMNYPTEWYCERCGAELAAL